MDDEEVTRGVAQAERVGQNNREMDGPRTGR
jgi:hypothetical protein